MAQIFVHFLTPADDGPIVSRAPQDASLLVKQAISQGQPAKGVQWVQSRLAIACRPDASLEEARHASGQRDAVTCPKCLASQEYLSQEFAAQSAAESRKEPMQPPAGCCE